MAIRKQMSSSVRRAFEAEMQQARGAEARGDHALCWRSLERAHVMSQPFAVAHVQVHLAMIAVAWRRRDQREVLGQVPRVLLAGPASLLGRAPRGNTGGSNVGILTPMRIPPDLEALIDPGGEAEEGREGHGQA